MRYEEALGEREALTARQARLAALRERVRRVERPSGSGRRVALGGAGGGWAAVDAALGGGLVGGALHEVSVGGGRLESAAGSAAGSAVGERFVLRVLARLSGSVLWCHAMRRGAALYGPGIAQTGLAQMGGNLAERLRIARVSTGSDGLWVAEEALRSGALSAVVLEPMQAIDLTASRRLQLAAEAGGTLGFILNNAQDGGMSGGGMSGGLTPSVATTRWQVAALPSDTAGSGVQRRWQLSLLRCRGGEVGTWEVEDDTA